VGLATAQLTGVIMVDVPMSEAGQASGSQSTVRQVGSALGIAVIGTMLFTGTELSLTDRLDALSVEGGQQTQIVDAVVSSAGGAIPLIADTLQANQVPQGVAQDIQSESGEAFTDGARFASYAAGGFLVLGLLSTLRLGRSASRVETAESPAEKK